MAKKPTKAAVKKPVVKAAVKAKPPAETVYDLDERGPRQGPLGDIPRKSESDLIAEAAAGDDS